MKWMHVVIASPYEACGALNVQATGAAVVIGRGGLLLLLQLLLLQLLLL
jgi:hypothetical protein